VISDEWTKEEQKTHREKFVSALRSGEYRQGKEFLRAKDDKFSVLGVAVDLAVKEGVVPEWVEKHDCYTCDGENGLLPHDVRMWLGFRGRYGRYMIDEMMFTLGEDNEYAVPFEELADIIESEPRKLVGKDIHDRHRPKY